MGMDRIGRCVRSCLEGGGWVGDPGERAYRSWETFWRQWCIRLFWVDSRDILEKMMGNKGRIYKFGCLLMMSSFPRSSACDLSLADRGWLWLIDMTLFLFFNTHTRHCWDCLYEQGIISSSRVRMDYWQNNLFVCCLILKIYWCISLREQFYLPQIMLMRTKWLLHNTLSVLYPSTWWTHANLLKRHHSSEDRQLQVENRTSSSQQVKPTLFCSKDLHGVR